MTGIENVLSKRLSIICHSMFSGFSDSWLLLFMINSIVLQMVLGQDTYIARFSLLYWALVLPALVIPCWSIGQIVKVFQGPGVLLFGFLICAGGFHLARSDVQAVMQLVLLIWVTAWCACESTRLTTDDLAKIFVATIILGLFVALLTDLNPWGVIPGYTAYGYGPWRVSFFPHIANSATFSFITLMFLTRDSRQIKKYGLIVGLCAYFILFGFVRSVLVAALIYFSLRAVFSAVRTRTPTILFVGSFLVVAGSIGCEWSAGPILEHLQHYPVVSRLFLRSYSSLDHTAMYEQLYRPWLWREHLAIFSSSPLFMGLGSFKLLDHVSYNLVPGLDAAGSESFPTRLLATYGLATVFFFAYLLAQLGKLARLKDDWACACFPAVTFMMMNWGSLFHPTNVLFLLFFLIIKGRLHWRMTSLIETFLCQHPLQGGGR